MSLPDGLVHYKCNLCFLSKKPWQNHFGQNDLKNGFALNRFALLAPACPG
jgi:hypothetical protein